MRISDWSSDVCSSDLSQPPSHIDPTNSCTAKMRESVRIFGRDVSTARLYAFPTCVSITGIGIAMADVGDVAAPEFGFQNGLSIGGRGDHPHFQPLKGLQCSFRIIRLLAPGDEQDAIPLLAPDPPGAPFELPLNQKIPKK